ncbi:MAG TPA: sensor histidine kinase [Pyrinomonadaceae bacterium]|nr:sensor histidine kinase [Pyrinomonadaceae bacterium]
MSDLQDKLEQIKTALAELRTAGADGPATRKQLDSLFRQVHTLKAVASADGLSDLARATHELENVLHSLRTGASTLDNHVLQELTENSTALSETLMTGLVPRDVWNSLKAHEKHALKQSISEGADIFLVDASFDVADFDREFQKLKEKLSSNGEVISVAPSVESEHPEKINFRILCASTVSRGVAVLQRAVRAGQAAATVLGKEIEFDVIGADVSSDETVSESVWQVVADPLLHLVRNAVDHGIEHRGKITITAEKLSDQLNIRVTDDGRGINPELMGTGQLFESGFSTASGVSTISGRGAGLDAVKKTVEARGGSVQIQSELDRGSTFEITLPLRSA